MKNKHYCSECNRMVEEEQTEVKEIQETYEIKKEMITYTSKVRICKSCGEIVSDDELEDENLTTGYNEYRKKHNLLLPEEIKNIRTKYALSATAFSKLLGFGEKTITRYENGALQDKSQNNYIWLMKDDHTFKNLWNKNKHILSASEIEKVEKKLSEIKKSKVTIIAMPYKKFHTDTNKYNFDMGDNFSYTEMSC